MKIKSCGTPGIDTIFFDWPLTNWCNYKCSYCPVLDQITNDFTKDDHTALYKVTLARLAQVETSFNICITGGEPTLHPNIIDILTALCNMPKAQNISVFTNLSRPVKFFEKLPVSNKLVLFASYHPEFATHKFIERCIEISKTDTLFSVHVTMSDNPAYWKQTQELIETLRANNIPYKPCLLAPTKDYKPNYNDEFRKEMGYYLETTGTNTAGNDFFKTIRIVYEDDSVADVKDYEIELGQLNRFKNYTCTPVSYQINMNGKVENTCTGRRVPIQLSNKNLIVKEVCPNEICPSKRLLNFYKEQ